MPIFILLKKNTSKFPGKKNPRLDDPRWSMMIRGAELSSVLLVSWTSWDTEALKVRSRWCASARPAWTKISCRTRPRGRWSLGKMWIFDIGKGSNIRICWMNIWDFWWFIQHEKNEWSSNYPSWMIHPTTHLGWFIQLPILDDFWTSWWTTMIHEMGIFVSYHG